jgi:serine/threonine protein kinase
MARNLIQKCGEVEFNRCLCKLLAETYMDSLDDLEKCLLKSDVEIDTKMLDSCRQVLAELCHVMCCGERLAKDWSNKDWWRSTVSSSDAASVQKRVELHMREFLSCVKVFKIAIAEARGDSTFDLSTMEHSQLLMSDIEIAFEEDRKKLLQHVQAYNEMEITEGTCGEGYELAKYLPERCNLKSQYSIRCQNLRISEDEVLGKGAFGTVYKCKVFGLMAAAKKFKPCADTAQAVEQEIKLFARLQHPNVVQCIGHILTEHDGPVLVSELMREDLRSYLDREVCMDTNEEKPFPLLVVLDIMLQIAEGMNYLHENDVMHRDLKSKNVLINVVKNEENLELSSSMLVKITDFGLAKLKENSQYSTKHLGTTPWRAPEMFDVVDNKNTKYTKAADVYSFAMVFFEVLTGKTPFSDVRRKDLYKKVCEGERPALPSKAYCPVYLSAFIDRCWVTKAKHRPQFPEICQMLVYCKELILRDTFPSPLNCIIQYDAEKLSSWLSPGWCIEEGLKDNLPIEVYSVVVFNALENEKLGDVKYINSVNAQLKAAKHFSNWSNRWQDADKAFKLFWNLAQDFHPEALYRVGLCFEHGFGTKQNNQIAYKYYLHAFRGGYDCASVELAWCLATGRGVDQNHNLAKSMLKKALAAQKQCQIRLPCITEMGQQLDHPSKSPDATTEVMDVLKQYQDTCRLKLDFIKGSSIGKKLIGDLFHNFDYLKESTIGTETLREPKTRDAIDLLDRVPGTEYLGHRWVALLLTVTMISMLISSLYVAVNEFPLALCISVFQTTQQLVGLCCDIISLAFIVYVCGRWAYLRYESFRVRKPTESKPTGTLPVSIEHPVLNLATHSYLCLPTAVLLLLSTWALFFLSWEITWLFLQCLMLYFVLGSTFLIFLSSRDTNSMLLYSIERVTDSGRRLVGTILLDSLIFYLISTELIHNLVSLDVHPHFRFPLFWSYLLLFKSLLGLLLLCFIIRSPSYMPFLFRARVEYFVIHFISMFVVIRSWSE